MTTIPVHWFSSSLDVTPDFSGSPSGEYEPSIGNVVIIRKTVAQILHKLPEFQSCFVPHSYSFDPSFERTPAPKSEVSVAFH